ncbi:MAG: uroporphyrinogen decarboxylase family protein [Candidatus Brocadiia bacterium]|jgi:uroporphyrinogen decarboxylase|nr:uroporphyrinogen decarboxylase family protein [Candidatus Brocadiia bacterium]
MISTLAPVEPDWEGMLRNLRREGTPERVYYFEHGIADNVLEALDARLDICRGLDRGDPHYDHLRRLAVHRFLGHELFRVFPERARITFPINQAGWIDESLGLITSWEDFESYDWLRPEDADLSVLEYYEKNLPEDMRVFHVLDVWEVVRSLFGFETFCYKLYEDPALVEAVVEKAGSFAEKMADALCDFECFGVLNLSDDLGYKTSLMISPEDVRRLFIPWHKRIADLAHRHGKLFFFHCCGNMYELIDDYIDYVRIDAKHSFEENVLPVTEVKRRYGDRLTLLGGMDVDLLARGNEQAIRARTREVLETCVPGGGYFLGSGNWVTEYIPVDSYLVMLDEARRLSADR